MKWFKKKCLKASTRSTNLVCAQYKLWNVCYTTTKVYADYCKKVMIFGYFLLNHINPVPFARCGQDRHHSRHTKNMSCSCWTACLGNQAFNQPLSKISGMPQKKKERKTCEETLAKFQLLVGIVEPSQLYFMKKSSADQSKHKRSFKAMPKTLPAVPFLLRLFHAS